MYSDQIRELVRDAYDGLGEPSGPATVLYRDEDLARLPDGVRRWALGVGNPIAHAGLQPGEDVVDLGCGAGIDTLLAAIEVGPAGRAIGVDMLASMVGRATTFAAEAGLDNADFLRAEMEQLPLPDESADVVISNGTINLSARKSRVLAEAHRVLRPGGRIVVSDPTIREDELPSEVLTHPSAWAG
jgi:arsenite methyltransferase